MARRETPLLSDPEFLIHLLDELSSDKSEDEFDGYVTGSSDGNDSAEETNYSSLSGEFANEDYSTDGR